MATLYLKSGGGNWSAAGTWSTTSAAGVDNSGPPTAADTTIAELASGNLTIDGTSGSPNVCRSLDTTSGTGSWGGTLTMGSAAVLTIGDATAGAGSVALKLNSGITSTPNAASTINFISTSATQQTIDCGGKTMGNITINAASNGNFAFSTALTNATSSTVTLTKGTLHTDGTSDTGALAHSWGIFNSSNANTRVLNLGNSAITMNGASSGGIWSTSTSTGMTLTPGGSTITMAGSNSGFQGGGLTYNNLVFASTNLLQTVTAIASPSAISPNTFNNLTITGNASKLETVLISFSQVITGTLTINGNSVTNRILVTSSTFGTAVTLTAAVVSVSNADFRDITAAGAGSWNLSAITGLSGDCGGNTGITFTTGATQTWNGTSGGNWSTNAWTSRVPLPQDDVVISSAFSASQTVTEDMPRMGKSVDWTGATGTPTWTFAATPTTVTNYGSITLISAMTLTVNAAVTHVMEGRSASFTLTSAGKTWNSFQTQTISGTITLQDAFSATTQLSIIAGTFNANNFNVTTFTFATTGTLTRTVTQGSGTWTLTRNTASTTAWNVVSTGLTWNANTSTIVLSGTDNNAKGFVGGGVTYNNLSITTGGTGAWTFSGNNSWTKMSVTGGSTKTVIFTAGSTQTFAGSSDCFFRGASGNLITCQSSTGGSAWTVSKASGTVSCDFLSLQDSTATGGANWYAGVNSTNVSGNTGWLFTAAPSGGTMLMLGV